MAGIKIVSDWHSHVDDAIHKVLSNLGEDIVEDAKRLVPVDSGDLRDSIKSDVEDKTLTVRASEDYASHVELGTKNMAAQPFLRPATYKQRGVRSK